jgi:membrane-bound lytic murein transglycosylase D
MLTLNRDTSINELTICLGNSGVRDGWFRALRNLNPRYEPHATIFAGTTVRVPAMLPKLYRDHCMANSPRAQLAADLVAARKPVVIAPPPPPEPVAVEVERPSRHGRRELHVKTYEVRRGDTISSIARHKGCDDAADLGRANGLRAPYALKAGMRLKLVGCER